MVDILTKKLMKWKLIKIHENTWKNLKKNDKTNKNTLIEYAYI